MAYVPPHKRLPLHDGAEKPELLSPVSMNSPKSRPWSSSSRAVTAPKYPKFRCAAKNYVWRWFALGLDDRNRLPSSVRLRPVPYESALQKVGESHLALICTELDRESCDEAKESVSPWISIAENVTRDLVSSFSSVRSEIENHGDEAVKSSLVARFGKVVFRSFLPESVTEALNTEDSLSEMNRHLRANLPKSYTDYVSEEGAQKIGLELKKEKEVYRVWLFDSSRSSRSLSCKCRVLGEDGKLELCKVEFSPIRYMVVDISCLEKNVDLRLILSTTIDASSDLTETDMHSIRNFVASAIIDPAVKGGLRWSPGRADSGQKFSLRGTWHSKTKTYVNSSMKLKIRESDRFDFPTSVEESARELSVELKKVASMLKEGDVEEDLIKEMLKEDLKGLWENFFCCESFLKWQH